MEGAACGGTPEMRIILISEVGTLLASIPVAVMPEFLHLGLILEPLEFLLLEFLILLPPPILILWDVRLKI